MAGEAKTSRFLLSAATLMVGPSADVFELTPAKHSIGLIKNVRVTTDPRFVELTQGLSNQVVFSVNTEMKSMIQGEVYEFTARNLAYAAGYDASGVGFDTPAPHTIYALGVAADDNDTDLTLAGSGNLTGWAVGDWVLLHKTGTDLTWAAPVTAVSASDRKLTFHADFSLPAGVTWATATTRVIRVAAIKVGADDDVTTVGVKLVGLLPDNNLPVQMVFPKVRITKGLDLSFQTSDFANMPFEFMPYALLPNDPFYSILGGDKPFLVNAAY